MSSTPNNATPKRPAPDKALIESLPEELRDLDFGSPEFKDANQRIAVTDEAECRPITRAHPHWINLTGTTVCNLKCIMCNQFLDPDHPKWFMTDEVYEKSVRELYPFAKTVQFSAFGEPLMTPGMEQKLDDLIAYQAKLDIVTNGTLMMRESRHRAKLLASLEQVTFSLDGSTRETFNSIRTGADFDHVWENITMFADARRDMPKAEQPRMNFNYIMMKRTVAEAPRFVEMVHELGGDEIVFNHLIEFHESLKGEGLIQHKDFANEHMDATRAVAEKLGVKLNIPPNFIITDDAPASTPVEVSETETTEPAAAAAAAARPCGPPPIKCWFLWQRVYIGPNGEVVPCCLAGMPFFAKLMDAPFHEIWNNDMYQRYRSKVYTDSPHGECRNCYLIYPSTDQISDEGRQKF